MSRKFPDYPYGLIIPKCKDIMGKKNRKANGQNQNQPHLGPSSMNQAMRQFYDCTAEKAKLRNTIINDLNDRKALAQQIIAEADRLLNQLQNKPYDENEPFVIIYDENETSQSMLSADSNDSTLASASASDSTSHASEDGSSASSIPSSRQQLVYNNLIDEMLDHVSRFNVTDAVKRQSQKAVIRASEYFKKLIKDKKHSRDKKPQNQDKPDHNETHHAEEHQHQPPHDENEETEDTTLINVKYQISNIKNETETEIESIEMSDMSETEEFEDEHEEEMLDASDISYSSFNPTHSSTLTSHDTTDPSTSGDETVAVFDLNEEDADEDEDDHKSSNI